MKSVIECPTKSERPAAAALPIPAAPGFVALDAWRGVAALMVVVFHATATYRSHLHSPVGAAAADLCSQVLDQGWLGVQLFFVISGYCIAATVDAARRKPSPVGTFALRRLVRVYPTFAIWLILMTLAIGLAEWWSPNADFWTKKARFVPLSKMHLADWLSNLTLTHTWLPRLFGIQSVTVTEVSWTLCYEVQFYFGCGLLLAICPRMFFPAVALLTLAMTALFVADSAMGHSTRWRGTFLDGRWLQFAMGIGVYYFVNYRPPHWQRAFAIFLVCVAIGCWFVRDDISANAHVLRKNLLEMTFCAAFAAVLIPMKSYDAAIRDSRLAAPLIRCGLISYSLYLVHWPFCKLITGGLWKAGVRMLPATLAVTVPVCMAASLGAAIIYYTLVERHFLYRRLQRK